MNSRVTLCNCDCALLDRAHNAGQLLQSVQRTVLYWTGHTMPANSCSLFRGLCFIGQGTQCRQTPAVCSENCFIGQGTQCRPTPAFCSENCFYWTGYTMPANSCSLFRGLFFIGQGTQCRPTPEVCSETIGITQRLGRSHAINDVHYNCCLSQHTLSDASHVTMEVTELLVGRLELGQ
jgi:hypothetical protein